MRNSEDKKIFSFLTLFFLIFYTLQIPLHTSKPDVVVFAMRALSKLPILNYAYLAPNTLIEGTALPNYHLGHTLILWLAYHLAPASLSNSIWLSGFVSSICGALIVGLTFLIWKELGIDKKKSVIIAFTVGFIPSIWEESLIGEIYAMQLLFILLFVYSFLRNKIFISIITFTFANLISPLSGLSFGLLLLKPWHKNTLKKIFLIGGVSLAVYLLIYFLIGSNLLNLLNPLSTEQEGRGIIYRIVVLIVFIILNFNFFSLYLYKGLKETFKAEKEKITKLLLATLPQLLLLFLGSTFFIELGSFQLPIFWALAFPLGYYLSTINFRNLYFALSFMGLVILSYTLWIYPNTKIGSSREAAGKWLKKKGYDNISIIGSWEPGINVLYGRDGFNLAELNKYYFDAPFPSENEIKCTKKDSVLIVSQKKTPLRILFSYLHITSMNIPKYEPKRKIKTGIISKLYENDSVLLYKWKK